MKQGIYHVGNRRIVINDHTTKEQIEALKKTYPQLDDNNIKGSSDNDKGLSESGQSKRKSRRKSKA